MASQWSKPNRVEVRNEQICAGFSSEWNYPLTDAIRKGSALEDLGVARTGKEIQKFVKKWGFLKDAVSPDRGTDEALRKRDKEWGFTRHVRGVSRSEIALPIAYFRAERAHVLALAQLATALRQPKDLGDAVRDYWNTYDPGLLRLPVQVLDGAVSDYVWTAEEKARLEDGVPWSQLSLERTWATSAPDWPLGPPGPCYVNHLLRQRLAIQTELRVVKRGHRWQLEDVPLIDTLEKALLWTLRTKLDVVLYRVCEDCGFDFLANRPNQRYCLEKCGNNARVKKYRRKQAKGRRSGGRRADRNTRAR